MYLSIYLSTYLSIYLSVYPQVAAWIMCTLLMVYAKVSIAIVMRSQGRTSLLWTGGSTQLGACIGAVLAYVMINHLHLFKDGPWCQ